MSDLPRSGRPTLIQWLALFMIGAGVFVTQFRPEDAASEWRQRTLVGILEPLRQHYAVVSVALMGVGMLLHVATNRSLRSMRLGVCIASFFVLQTWIFLRMGLDGPDAKTDVAAKWLVGSALLVMFEWLAASPGGIQLRTVRAIGGFGLAAAVTFIAVLWQGAVDIGAMQWQGRWMGITDHPQHLGVFSGCFIGACILLHDSSTKWLPRAMFTVTGLAMVALLVLSASRSAILAFVVGCAAIVFVSENRVRNLLVGLLAGGMVGVAGLVYVATGGGSVKLLDRFAESGDTRAGVWADMAAAFVSSPVIGTGRAGHSESSYFVALASGGVIAGFFFLLFLGALLLSVWGILTGSGKDVIPLSVRRFLAYTTVFMIVAATFEGFLIQALQVFSVSSIYMVAFIIIVDRCTFLTRTAAADSA